MAVIIRLLNNTERRIYIEYQGWAGYQISGVDQILGSLLDIQPDNRIFHQPKIFVTKFLITIQLGSVRMSLCPYVRPSICYMHEVLLTYCYRTRNLRNYAMVCLFKRILVAQYKRLYTFSLRYYLSCLGYTYLKLIYLS